MTLPWALQFHHLYSTNDVPTPIEKATIQHDLATIQQGIAVLQERAALCRALLAPIRHLPLETLGRIFELSVTDYRGVDKASVATLCLVCKTWRRAAHLTHTLWTDVRVDRPVLLDRVFEWLKRAGTMPKTLRFTQDNEPACEKHHKWDDEEEDDDTGSPKRCKLAEAQHLEYLANELPLDSLCIAPWSYLCISEFLLSPNPRFLEATSWTSLRSLELNMRFIQMWPEIEEDPTMTIFNYLPPSLTSLIIDFPRQEEAGVRYINPDDFNGATTAIRIPASTLGRLTSFTIRCDWNGPQIATLLQHCGKLEHLTVEYFLSEGEVQEWTEEPNCLELHDLPPRIRLPHLRTLHVHAIPAQTASTVLHFLDVPALVELSVSVYEDPSDDEYEEHPAYHFLESLGFCSPLADEAALLQYSHLISTNDPPTSIEKASIRQDVAALQQDIAELETRLAKCRMLLAPIRSLPPEILGYIFEITVKDAYSLIKKQVLEVICLVCKAWQRAAHFTHSLWTHCSIEGPHIQLDKAMTWLRRSGAMPKTFRIRDLGKDCDEHNTTSLSDGSLKSQCPLLAPRRMQQLVDSTWLDTLRITSQTPECIREFLLLANSSSQCSKTSRWSAIRALELAMGNCSEWIESQSTSKSMFAHLPQSLSSLKLELPWVESEGLDDSAYSLNIPTATLGHLTSFTLRTDWRGPQLAILLQHCGMLEHLAVEYIHETENWHPWTQEPDCLAKHNLPPHILLPKLRTFIVHGVAPNIANSIFHFLRVPALLSLTIGLDQKDDLTDDNPNEDLFAQYPTHPFLLSLGLFAPNQFKAKSLESLTIGDWWERSRLVLTGVTLTDIALHLTSLKRLTLYHVQSPHDPFKALSQHMDRQHTYLLPRLEHLELSFSDDKYPLESVFHFVKLRHNHRPRSPEGQLRDSLRMVVVCIPEYDQRHLKAYNTSPTVAYIRRSGISVERSFRKCMDFVGVADFYVKFELKLQFAVS
ncbi:hypothetical protein DFP72DRAFT_1149269 [Ephemerocybe angulata]|uniref:F-box domain-containing protein n=1 Tax=Ephemerocybe angulata TaxID=980116 RepID=A0A8H6HJA2_9AGAR|nr:hypothetical protein DFP72DRAFT_1149269 [Tulosesus angulatus]